jgi:hypothetical protein
MSAGDNCRIAQGMWGLYIHHDCLAHKYDLLPEYVKGSFDSRKQETV